MKIETFEREVHGKKVTSVSAIIEEGWPHFAATLDGTGPDIELLGAIQAASLAKQHLINLKGLRNFPWRPSLTVFGCPHCQQDAIAQEILFGKYVTKFACGTRAVSNSTSEPLKPIKEPEIFPSVVDNRPLEYYRFSPREGVVTIRTHNCLLRDLFKTKERLQVTLILENRLSRCVEEIQQLVDKF